ncbi:MAG: AbrB/MazE/SpoVT family DNA-binding domain-containing protein [Phycisphaerae bacterium]|nr:AbrB/MazE/SpoVT family DNA-binding domain-containing protein [Phycisphaerae bacterium]
MTVTVSPKFQVVIPKDVRERMGIRPGLRMEVIEYLGRVELIPVGPMRSLRGFAKGIDTTVPRDDEDRV